MSTLPPLPPCCAALHRWCFTLLAALACVASVFPEDVCEAQRAPGCAASTPESLLAKWGIEVTSLRMSANGYMVDFRYRVLDPEKAATVASEKSRPYLVDDATGAKLLVPRTPKVGPLRQTVEKLTPGKVYWMVFANPGRVVSEGSKVSISIGDFRADHLTVQKTETLASAHGSRTSAQVAQSASCSSGCLSTAH